MPKKLNMIALMILLMGQVILGPIGNISAFAADDPPAVAPDQVAETDITVADDETVTTLVSESETTTDINTDTNEPGAEQAIEPQSEQTAEVDEAPPSDEEGDEEATFSLMGVEGTTSVASGEFELFTTKVKSITVYKVDAASTNTKLPGATFGLYTSKDKNATAIQTKGPTTSDGKVVFTGLEKGKTYYVKEIQQPTGYNLNESYHKVQTPNQDSFNKDVTVENDKIPTSDCEAEEAGPGKSDCRHVYVTKLDMKGKPVEDITFYTSRNNDKWGRTGVTNDEGKATLEFAHNGNTFLTEANGDYKLCKVLEDGDEKKSQKIIEHKRKDMDKSEYGIVFQDNKDKYYTFINAPTGTDCADDGKGKITINKTFTDVSKKPFPVVTFKLFKNGVDTGKTATTHQDTGVVTFTDLDFGDYYVEEVALAGYEATYNSPGSEANPVKVGRDKKNQVDWIYQVVCK